MAGASGRRGPGRPGTGVAVSGAANPLMLVSAKVDERLRREVADGARPRPEFLILEQDYGFRLFDRSHLPSRIGAQNRSPLAAAVHVRTALRHLDGASGLLSDGEHLGIPLGYALRARGLRVPHVVISHHLDSAKKRALFRHLGAARGIDRILVHTERQHQVAIGLGVPPERVTVLPYAIDTDFWEPCAERPPGSRAIVSSVGIERRDYATFVDAMRGLPAQLVVSIGSTHSPTSDARLPERWPHTAEVSFAPPSRLRLRYADARVVVVPIVETDFPAGVTSILEAMAMAKPVVVSGTRGLGDLVRDGDTGLVVPPGDAAAMHRAVRLLLDDQLLRHRLAIRARAFVVAQAGVDRFAARLAGQVGDLLPGRHRCPSFAAPQEQ